MPANEKKEHVDRLWQIVRDAKDNGQLKNIYDGNNRWLSLEDQSLDRVIDHEEEDELLQYMEQIETSTETLPWYIISPKSTFYKVQEIQIQIMTWFTMVVTPVAMVFPTLRNDVKFFEWMTDCSWSVEIILCFVKADEHNTGFLAIATNYLKFYFIFDILATVPPMATGQKNVLVNFLKFLRLVHFQDMFKPFELFLNWMYPNMS